MPEQSIGMATGTGVAFGDGNVGAGYTTARMTDMETKTFNDGVLIVGGNFALSGVGTSNLNIADGAAIVGGYFYENTSSTAISVLTGVANGTYNVVILVNELATPITVTRAASGTTVLAKTVRLCIATNAQLVGQIYVKVGEVSVNATQVNGTSRDSTRYGTTTMMPYQSYATLTGGTATVTLANTNYDLAFTTASVSTDLCYDVSTGAGTVEVFRLGLYLVNAFVAFGTGTTGNRLLSVQLNGSNVQSTRAAAPGTASHTMTQTSLIEVTALPAVLKPVVQSSLAGQTISSGTFIVSRA